ncbi:hypothetical protein [Actinosynnema sp. NPDC020468]|uniref:hypothetical protein n=1 Tax=Actinosynnema sp. NPDC020468 TaxID=3154488 RepID=UPI0033ED6771
MAVQTMILPPIFVDNTEFNADPVRRVLSAILGGKPGFLGNDALQSTVNGGDYTVTVSPGVVALPSPSSGFPGVFLAESAASVSVAIAPPHSTQTRVDALVAYAVPPVGLGAGTWRLETRAGTPSGTPVAPTVPGSLLLDEITVPSAASSQLPTKTSRRLANGQHLLGGTVLSGSTRPTDARAGTVWADWANGNAWVWGDTRWYPVGVPRFASIAARNTAFDNPVEGSLAVTRDPYTLWCYTGSATGWQPVGDTVRAHHGLVASASVPPTTLTTLPANAFAAGHDGGIATLSGGTIRLNREGRWSIGIMVYSDANVSGLSQVRFDWTNGALYTPDITATATRGTGFSGAGTMHQLISWTGNVTAAQATAPMKVQATWFPLSGNPTLTYTAWVTLEYLGR